MKIAHIVSTHCLTIVLFFISFVSAQAADETLFYDWVLMNTPPFFLSTTPRTGTTTFNNVHVLPINLEGNISSGTVASGTLITGEIMLAASDSVVGNREEVNFILTLKKNGVVIGTDTIPVLEGASLVYAAYTVSFTVADSISSSDDLIWRIEASVTVAVEEDRGMQLDPDHSKLVFPLKDFFWPMFLPAMVSH